MRVALGLEYDGRLSRAWQTPAFRTNSPGYLEAVLFSLRVKKLKPSVPDAQTPMFMQPVK